MLTSCLFNSVVEELKPRITVLQIQLVVRAGTELEISDSQSGVLAANLNQLGKCNGHIDNMRKLGSLLNLL